MKRIEPLLSVSESQDPSIKIIDEDAGVYDGNIITSEKFPDVHIPLIDIDMEAALIPSSTPGHYHLYIDKELSFDDYMKLLMTMAQVGIVQWGVVEGVKKRGYSSLRMPHIKKGDQSLPIQNGKQWEPLGLINHEVSFHYPVDSKTMKLLFGADLLEELEDDIKKSKEENIDNHPEAW